MKWFDHIPEVNPNLTWDYFTFARHPFRNETPVGTLTGCSIRCIYPIRAGIQVPKPALHLPIGYLSAVVV
jgi:hypothetical protein